MKILDLRKVRIEPPSITFSAHTSKYRHSVPAKYRDSNSPVVTDRECLLLCPDTQCLLAHPSTCETPPIDIILPCPPSHPCSFLANKSRTSTTTSSPPSFSLWNACEGKDIDDDIGLPPSTPPTHGAKKCSLRMKKKPFGDEKGREAYSKFHLWCV